jgi:RNA polymerase sigma-70 factor (ECF subfamily)
MLSATDSSAAILDWLERLKLGDETARGELILRSQRRLRELVRFLLRHEFPRLRRFEETDDVLIEAQLRLHRSLAEGHTVPR